MITITGYQIHQLIYESASSLVYRGCQQHNNQPVILKVLKDTYPNPAELTRYKLEYEITRSLAIEGVVKAYELQKYQNTLVMVLEDFGGESLEFWLTQRQFSLKEFLTLAMKITEILGEIHAANIIHKDINPANIVYNPVTGQCKIIDFGISTVLSQENPTLKNPQVLEGTLAYMSPEQTGRMNRSLDYRTDFYSLGVTFYQLLAHQLPFETKDTLELVHCHLAKQPVPLSVLGCPKALSDIVMKLMAKMAEERYQTTWGIKADMSVCLQQLQRTGKITEFTLARHDLTHKFQIPQKLYGREQEVNTLLSAFERVSQGATEMMLVTGYSGIGKSCLVQEIYKPITGHKGYFICGKFDQFQRDIPYSAIVNAFSELVQQLLTESKAQLERWKEKLLNAFGVNAQVIIDVIPEVELIVGKQPAVPELGATESQNRFHLVFSNFIGVFCASEHPLVMFLDDLQWADSATLKLMELIMKDEQTQYLFLIGAYRNNEVEKEYVTFLHPLIMTLEELLQAGVTINRITLTPLALEHICHLTADTLNSDTVSVKPLAELVLRKTQGNPFFINQFLKTLYQEKLLTCKTNKNPKWHWDIPEIEAMAFTDNVIELMVSKLKKLPESTQYILHIAACVGNSFALKTLAVVQEKSEQEIFEDLLPAIQEELIIPLSNLELSSEDILIAQLLVLNLKFLHDRVQQAADALFDENYKKTTHLKIGRLLLKNTTPETLSENIFKIIDHLNLGIDLVNLQTERDNIAQLNLMAALKAKAATAYKAAHQYLNLGRKSLSADSWHSQYDLTFALYRQKAEIEYLIGNFVNSKKLIHQIFSHAKSALEKAEIYNLLLMQYSIKSQHDKAIQVGREALKILGIDLPQSHLEAALEKELIQTREYLNNRKIDSLLDTPEMVDKEKKVVMKLLNYLVPSTFQTCQPLFFIITVLAVNLSLQYGCVAESAYMYACYGVIQCTFFNDYKSAYEFSLLAIKLSEKFNYLVQKTLALEVMVGHISHWRKPLYLSYDLTQEAYKAGLNSGEFQFASYTLLFQSYNRFYQGCNLQQYLEELNNYLLFARKVQSQPAIDVIIGCQITVSNLIICRDAPGLVSTDETDEFQHFEDCKQRKVSLFICPYLVLKSQILYLFDKQKEALKYAIDAENLLADIPGVISIAAHNFYSSLILTNLYPTASEPEQKQYLLKLEENQKKMKQWAENCPENFHHKYLLVAAEMARILGKLEAIELYERALASAQENGFIQNQALAAELAAKFWLAQGKEEFAQTYLKKAHYTYQLWGAQRKVEDLEEKYPHLLTTTETKTLIGEKRLITNHTSTNRSLAALDITTVLKASQAISSEIVYDKLLASLMRILIENAGAQTGFLLLKEAEKLRIEASASVDGEVTVFLSTPVEDSVALPLTVINYVERTRLDVVLNHAAVESKFTTDSYINQRQLKSLLCTPILNQGKLIGLLYLENNLTVGAFTPERVEVLKLLSAQAAISLENALLYTKVEQKVKERTQELNEKNLHLEEMLSKLQRTQAQLIQSEKMSSLGQLVAGVAHEINNPTSFIYGNLTHAQEYIQDLVNVIELYQQYYPNPVPAIQEQLEAVDLDFLMADLPKLLSSIKVGAQRIKQIVLSLRTFSRMDEAEYKTVDIHEGIDSSLMILDHRLRVQHNRPAIAIVKEYDNLPLVECYAGQLNQVFMNILVNAIDALDGATENKEPKIHIQTSSISIPNRDLYTPGAATTDKIPHSITPSVSYRDENRYNNWVLIKIADNGPGIPLELQQKLFDPFFTTKPIGKGTGMGLSISYQIVTEKHGGALRCVSSPGSGAEFVIEIPLRQGSKSAN